MKRYEVRDFGVDQLAFTDSADLTAGPGQVVIRMRAWSLNYRDLMVVSGTYNPRLKRPMVPLSDGAGEVVEVGEGVSRVTVGQRVFAAFMQRWLDGEPDETALRSALGGGIGGGIDGVAAEYVVLDAEGLVPVPDYLSYEEAATLPCAAVTAWHALVTEGHLRPDETVLTLGTGGVSIFALQFATLMKASVVATSGKPGKIERVRAMGVRQVINYNEFPDWHKAVRDSTEGRGVDQVVEVGGVGTLDKSMRAVRPGGKIHLIGALTGRGEVDLTPVFMRNVRLQGIFVGSRKMAEDMCRAMAGHELRPVVDRVFRFTELGEALRYLESGSHFGKIVLTAA